MKVLHVINSLDPAVGGPPAVAIRLAAAQASLGHDIAIASYASPQLETQARRSLVDVPHADGVQLHFLPPPRNAFERISARAMRRLLTDAVSLPDVLHLHGVWDPIILSAASAATARRVPYVVAPHGMLDPWSMRQRRWKKQLALRLGFGRMLHGAAFLHTLNTDEARLIEPASLRAKARIIPNGVFLEEINPLPERERFHANYPALGNKPYILFLSRLHYKKGLDVLAEAFAEVAEHAACGDLQLVVAGPDGGARGEFERQVHLLGISARVHVVGALYGQEKLTALAGATCFCLPSRQEGFSVAITEALACGVPVVISRNCHFPEVADAGAGEVVPLDCDSVAAAVVRVATNPDLRRRMGDAGRALVAANYTWKAIARRSTELYANALQIGGDKVIGGHCRSGFSS